MLGWTEVWKFQGLVGLTKAAEVKERNVLKDVGQKQLQVCAFFGGKTRYVILYVGGENVGMA